MVSAIIVVTTSLKVIGFIYFYLVYSDSSSEVIVFVNNCICNSQVFFHKGKGSKSVCLCSGMKKNEKLEANIITPTTKAADHDLPISGAEVHETYILFLGFPSLDLLNLGQ